MIYIIALVVSIGLWIVGIVTVQIHGIFYCLLLCSNPVYGVYSQEIGGSN